MPDPTVTIAEHTVYDAVCTCCPWTSGGYIQREWAEHVAREHEKKCEGQDQ